jgi:prepilin-type N-terminal cleavage/methylation domain-containing protein
MPKKVKIKKGLGQQGFTLLELMISLVLMGVVVLITAGAMRLGTRAAESGQSKIESIERFRTSLNIIESQIQSAVVIRNTNLTADLDFFHLKGDRKSLQFRSLYSLWGGSKGPIFAAYEVREENMGSKTLYVTENPIIIPDAAREVRLIEGAKDIFFEYYHKGPTDEKGSWVDDWTDKQVIPERIRVTISRDKQVLALIIPLKVAAKTQQSSQVAPPKK